MLVDHAETLEKLFAESPLLIATHCEDTPIINRNLAHYKELFGDQIPPQYHPIIRSREACFQSSSLAVALARKYGSRLHLLHLSTADEIALLTNETRTQKRITGEVCVHHLWFNDSAYLTKGHLVKWNPAIKTETDRLALLQGVQDGFIDIIATDHAPHDLSSKQMEYEKASNGIIGIQTAAPLVYTNLVKTGLLSFEDFEKVMSSNALKLAGLEENKIEVGAIANLCVLDIDNIHTYKETEIESKGHNCPYINMSMYGFNTLTICNGKVVYQKQKGEI
jgi:dihydroorotase